MPTAPDLYRANIPSRFWRVTAPEATAAQWDAAVREAATELPATARAGGDDVESLLYHTLGEGQFGPDHWRLSPFKRLYYAIKPVLPRPLTRRLRQVYGKTTQASLALSWPIELRYARFQWDLIQRLVRLMGIPELRFIQFWPDGHAFAFVLTHDVETAEGQAYVRAVADLDARYGFRSSFNFVPERYALDYQLIDELRARGFEIGIHGLKHDGKLFTSRAAFLRKAERINRALKQLNAVGFRAELTHRHPEWMQALEIEYDASFFDTDAYEPIHGGTMSLWPFVLGRFVELPYTLAQDYTVTEVLQETTPRLWLEKVDVIRGYSGMALLNTHPDYLRSPRTWLVYEDLLRAMQGRSDYWHALPREVARWWRARDAAPSVAQLPRAVEGRVTDSEVALFALVQR
jgi:peptidoglycan/xylan/chitin deacetylase (PgdA/CDA1 family)